MNIGKSGENYLKAILLLQEKNGYARCVDIAAELLVSKPSVSRAVRLLKKSGYVTIHNHQITLSKTGNQYAIEIYRKHCIVNNFSNKIGVPENLSSKTACKLEHDVSSDICNKIEELFKQDNS